jgi:nucleotidyltransferase substrate binding protein (TIGR01987 family)
MEHDIRWKQRFQNFDRAVVLLREPITHGVDHLSDLEKEGVVQRFEFTLELAWKTLKDYLDHVGTVIQPVTPRAVIKAAFAAQIIEDGQVWIDMLDHRNLLSHTYDRASCDTAVQTLHDRYMPAIESLHAWCVAHSAA